MSRFILFAFCGPRSYAHSAHTDGVIWLRNLRILKNESEMYCRGTNLLDDRKHEEEESLTGTVNVKSKDPVAYLLNIERFAGPRDTVIYPNIITLSGLYIKP
jgi:hypothetical protein